MSTPKRLAKYEARRNGRIPEKKKVLTMEEKKEAWIERMRKKGVWPK